MNTSSLHDYQLSYPLTATLSTISQTRGLAAVLARIEHKKERRLRRKALLQRSVAPLLTVTTTLKRALLHQRPRPFATLPSRRPVAA